MNFLANPLVLALLIPALATAEDSVVLMDNDGKTVRESTASPMMETVIVTGRRNDQQARTLIGAVGQLAANDLTRVGHAHISEATARLPGVWLSRGNGQELLPSVRSPVFTGAGSCAEILVTEDSLPIRPTGMCNVNQLFEINTEQAAGLEVWRGPGTVFYGSNAMHGVINSLSADIDRNTLSVETGSHDYRRVKLGWQQEQGSQRWQVAANGVRDGGFKDQSGFDQQKVTIKHAWTGDTLTAKTHLSAVNLNQETAGYVRGDDAYKDPAIWKTNPNPEAYRDAQALRLSTQLSGTTATTAEWQITPYLRRSDMVFLQHFLPGQPLEENGQTSAGVQSSYKTSLNASTTIWLGSDIEWASMWVKEFQANALGSPNNVRFQGQHYDFDVDSQQIALFANAEWQANDRLSVETGLRFEYLQYDYRNNMLSGTSRDDGSACASATGSCRYYRPQDRTDSTSNTNIHAGLDYRLSEQLSAYVRVASAYRAPQINELYRLQLEQNIDAIDAEKLRSSEAGLRFQQENLSAEVNVYTLQKEQVIVSDSSGYIVNDGETRHRGVEWQLRYALDAKWQIGTAGAWSKHQYAHTSLLNGLTINGNIIDTAPQSQGSAHVLFQPSDSASAELEWLYLGRYFLDAENDHEYPGHQVLNLTLQKSYRLWELRLRATNLTDKRIADRADYAFGSYRYFVGEGRGFVAEVKRFF